MSEEERSRPDIDFSQVPFYNSVFTLPYLEKQIYREFPTKLGKLLNELIKRSRHQSKLIILKVDLGSSDTRLKL